MRAWDSCMGQLLCNWCPTFVSVNFAPHRWRHVTVDSLVSISCLSYVLNCCLMQLFLKKAMARICMCLGGLLSRGWSLCSKSTVRDDTSGRRFHLVCACVTPGLFLVGYAALPLKGQPFVPQGHYNRARPPDSVWACVLFRQGSAGRTAQVFGIPGARRPARRLPPGSCLSHMFRLTK